MLQPLGAARDVAQVQVVDAADFGVPQTRKRVLFLGVRRDLGIEPPLLEGSGATSAITFITQTQNEECMSDLKLSDRVQRIKPSPTLAVTTRAAELRAQGKDPEVAMAQAAMTPNSTTATAQVG